MILVKYVCSLRSFVCSPANVEYGLEYNKLNLFNLSFTITNMMLLFIHSKEARWPHICALEYGSSFPVRSLAGDIVLCSWTRYLILTVSLKCVPVNLLLL